MAPRARAGCSSASATSPTTSSTRLEWQDHARVGALSRIDLAFSRDQPEKIYVQHRLWERRAELQRWIDDGAHVYVCGDEKGMARDVESDACPHPRRARGDAAARQAERAGEGRPLSARRLLTATSSEAPPPDCQHPMTDRQALQERASSRRRAVSCAARIAEGLADSIDRRDRRRRHAAHQVPRHLYAGRPRRARRAGQEEAGKGLQLHAPRCALPADVSARKQWLALDAIAGDLRQQARSASLRARPSSFTASSSRT